MTKKTFKQFLSEAPLPDDWDSEVFNPRVPFSTRIKYAKERAQTVGTGSSRVAFVIPYEGRKTVLKVAKNKKGMAQNEVEATALEDWYLKKLGIVIPMIDYDEANESPTWIHTEFATKAKESDFKRLTGLGLRDLINYCSISSGRVRGDISRFGDIDQDNEFIIDLTDMIGNYTHLPTGDFERLANWGIYNGSPVIIDIGLDDTVYQSHYRR